MSDVTGTYYAGDAIVGYGAQLLVGNGASPETFEAIADIMSITPGEMKTDVVEKTHLRSPEAHREKKATLRDSGPFTLTGNWRPDHESQSNAGGGSGSFVSGGLLAMWRNRTEANFKISHPDFAQDWAFRGVVTKFQPGEITVDQKINFTAEITPLQDFSAQLP